MQSNGRPHRVWLNAKAQSTLFWLTSLGIALTAVWAQAGQTGNVTLAGAGTCGAMSGTVPLQVSSFPTKGDDGSPTTTYKLSLLTQSAKAGLQNVVVTLVQSGDGETGHASLFNKTLFDGVVEGEWAGKFSIDKFSSFTAPSVKVSASGCTLTLTDGLAVLAF